MRIESKTVTVKIGDPADEAVLVFSRLKANAQARIASLISQAKEANDNLKSMVLLKEYQSVVLGACQSVTNLFEDGVAVTLESLHECALYEDTINLITGAYFSALNPPAAPEAAEKNASGEGLPAA